MGPVLIFDKSVLQGLNPDEAMWLDNFFLSNITPLFFVETLADLEKEVQKGRTPEEVVGNLAYKTPEFGKPNAHHRYLLEGELRGVLTIDMEYGRPHISGGKVLELKGKTGVIYQPSPEEEALSRWERYQFIELERMIAKAWRRSLSGINFDEIYKSFQIFYPIGKPKTFADVKKFVDFYIAGPDQERLFIFGLSLIGVSLQSQAEIAKRWINNGKPFIKEFAPYFTHVFAVDLFFNLAIAADLIGRGRPSHKIDLAYLYYLPFCMVFASNDNLHADVVPFFLRDNQTFVKGVDLKADLAKLDINYSNLPEEIKERGVMTFAQHPPHDDSFLTTRLWDKHMSSSWRAIPDFIPRADDPLAKKITEEMQLFEKEGTPVREKNGITGDTIEFMLIKRRIRAKKGKWTRFPPEMINRRKNEKGEWKDPGRPSR